MKLSIIGAAGHVGSCAAFTLGISQLAEELVLIDAHSPDRLAQYVYDLTSAVVGLDVTVRQGAYDDLRASDIVLIAAGSADMTSKVEALKHNLYLMQDFASRIKSACPGAIVVTATNPVDPLNYALARFSGFDRRQLIGCTANDSLRFRMLLADALGVKSRHVQGTVVGEHGSSQVPLFSSVRVSDRPILVSEDVKRRIRREVAGVVSALEGLRVKTGRTSAWTTAMGLAAVCRAIRYNTGETMPCSVVLKGEYGRHNMSISVPVSLGKQGVCEIKEWPLLTEEREALDRSVNALMPAMEFVDQFLARK